MYTPKRILVKLFHIFEFVLAIYHLFSPFIQGSVQRTDALEMGSILSVFGRERWRECCSTRAFLAILPVDNIKPWKIEQRVFAYNSFVRYIESITAEQREFRHHFDLHRNRAVLSRDTIYYWVQSLRMYWSTKNHQEFHDRFELQKMWNAFDKTSFAVWHNLLGNMLLNFTSAIVR